MIAVDGHPIVTDAAEATRLLEKNDVIGFDCETTGLSPWRDRIATMQFYGRETGTAAMIQLRNGIVPTAIMELFRLGKKMIVHNGVGFDLLMLDTHNVPWQKSKWYDTLVGETLVTSSGRRDVSVSLRASVKRRLGTEIDKNVEHGGWENNTLSEDKIAYAIRDVLSLPALMHSQEERALASHQDEALNMEQQLVPIFAQMTLNGLPMKETAVREYRNKQQNVRADSRNWLLEHLPADNYDSPAQVKRALSMVDIEVPNTRAETLTDLVLLGGRPGEIAEHLLAYRHAAQRVKMYSEDWIAQFIVNGRIHPRFWQCSTDTTRISSSNPNVQQIPKDGRVMIGNDDDYMIVSADYSQIEIRVAAWVARDEELYRVFEDGADVHSSIAAVIFDVPIDEVTPRQRKLSKAISFLLLFGGGAVGLYNYSRRGGSVITLEESRSFVRTFFQRFRGLSKFRDYAEARANTGFVTVKLPNGTRRVLAGRNCTSTRILNTTVQGTAAVGHKYGILEADSRGLTTYLGASIHDELVAAVPTALAVEYKHELAESMIVGMRRILDIPVLVESKVGDVWQP